MQLLHPAPEGEDSLPHSVSYYYYVLHSSSLASQPAIPSYSLSLPL